MAMAKFTYTGGNTILAVKELSSAIRFYQEVFALSLVSETNGKANLKSEGSIYDADLILLQTEPFKATGNMDEKWNVQY
jgi:catechol-2,3-dioxygenase